MLENTKHNQFSVLGKCQKGCPIQGLFSKKKFSNLLSKYSFKAMYTQNTKLLRSQIENQIIQSCSINAHKTTIGHITLLKCDLMTSLQAFANSDLGFPARFVPNTLSFSTKTVSAVSVDSPTFS